MLAPLRQALQVIHYIWFSFVSIESLTTTTTTKIITLTKKRELCCFCCCCCCFCFNESWTRAISTVTRSLLSRTIQLPIRLTLLNSVVNVCVEREFYVYFYNKFSLSLSACHAQLARYTHIYIYTYRCLIYLSKKERERKKK